MFRFRLEKVLQHRRRQVDAHARAVARAEHAAAAAAAGVRAASEALAGHDALAAASRASTIDVRSLVQARSWRDELAGRLKAAERRQLEAWAALEEAQRALRQAWREREALERLRTHQHEEWKHTEGRRRQRELDEVASIRAAIGAGAAGAVADGGSES